MPVLRPKFDEIPEAYPPDRSLRELRAVCTLEEIDELTALADERQDAPLERKLQDKGLAKELFFVARSHLCFPGSSIRHTIRLNRREFGLKDKTF